MGKTIRVNFYGTKLMVDIETGEVTGGRLEDVMNKYCVDIETKTDIMAVYVAANSENEICSAISKKYGFNNLNRVGVHVSDIKELYENFMPRYGHLMKIDEI